MNSNLFIGLNRIHLERVDSTNNYARQLVRDKMPVEGTVVTASAQTEGRGQRTNSWFSEPDLNLTASYILRPAFLAAKDQFMLSASVALAVFDVVKRISGSENAKIKWPNDILVNERKVAGILIENTLRGMTLDHSIVGIGINVNQTEFPKGLFATSLASETGKTHELEHVLSNLNSDLEKHYLRLRQGDQRGVLSQFNTNLFAFGEVRKLLVNGREDDFRILGARPSGELQLEDTNGRNSLHQHHEIVWDLHP